MKKVLVFDDDIGILEVTKIILKDKGYKVKTLSTFENAFKNIDTFCPDMILIDLWMPGINGEEIVKQIKMSPEKHTIPVVILSASKNTQEIAKESGADDFLCKPFDINDLEEIVDKYIKHKV
jgi:DNA-binding response OmpR family regulator